jgi:transglutaminase-like putative cysteine protease
MNAGPPARSRLRHTPIERDATATLALALYSTAVAVGFARVFSGWDFLGDLMLLVIVGHGLSFVMRRARVSGWIAIPALALVLGWVLAMYQYRATTTALVPGRATWNQVEFDIDLVRDQFQTAVAPVIYEVGWATLAGLAMIVVIVMADSFAFRAEARGEALVPGGVLFVFIAALGSPRLRVATSVMLIGAGIVAVIALRALHDRTRRIELASGRPRRAIGVPAVLASAAVIAIVAGLIGPRIPGAGADPLYDTRGRSGGITEITSPLVDIRSRLVNRGNVELFRVNADVESYWRSTTLPEFDGETFRLPRRSLTRVDDVRERDEDAVRIRQQVQILSLDGPLIPAAADPEAVNPNADVRLNSDTNTLVKTSDLEPEEQYTILSRAPEISADALRAATASNPPDEVFLGLPDDLPEVVEQRAREVTAGAATPYDQMRALQDWFQTFEYSTEVQSGHSSSAIESFLQIKTGYCEQFAATMAAMARTLGVPSRVAVGFTPGRLRDDGWYSVLGKNSHAWPEIWFDGIGWVPFEPTPSRGIPGATDYTGLDPAQDTSPPRATGDAGEAPPLPATPTTVFAPPTTRAPGLPQDPDAREQTPGGTPRPPASTAVGDGGGVPWQVFALLGLGAVAAGFPAAARRVRKRALRQQPTPERVAAAWQRACQAVTRAGVPGRDSMTASEWATATAHQLPVAARPMASLAHVVDRMGFSRPGSFGPDSPGAATLGRDCELWSEQVGRIAGDTLNSPAKLRRYFNDWR